MTHINKKFFKYSFFIIIPILSVFLCRLFMIAQGEKNEEIVMGIMIGIVLDLLYSIYLLVRSKRTKTDKRKNKIITFVIFSCIVVIVIGFFFSSTFTSYVDTRTTEYKALKQFGYDYQQALIYLKSDKFKNSIHTKEI